MELPQVNVLRGLLITLASGILFALLGAAAGYGLGAIAPDYYRTVFRVPPGVQIDARRTGFGLGVTQGFGAGLLTGLVADVAVAWSSSRSSAQARPNPAAGSHPDP